MRTAFHEQLDALTRSIGDMCGLAGTAMQRATQALLDADIVSAEIVISDHDNLVIQASQADHCWRRHIGAVPPPHGRACPTIASR
jgi:phosphate transport system protein